MEDSVSPSRPPSRDECTLAYHPRSSAVLSLEEIASTMISRDLIFAHAKKGELLYIFRERCPCDLLDSEQGCSAISVGMVPLLNSGCHNHDLQTVETMLYQRFHYAGSLQWNYLKS